MCPKHEVEAWASERHSRARSAGRKGSAVAKNRPLERDLRNDMIATCRLVLSAIRADVESEEEEGEPDGPHCRAAEALQKLLLRLQKGSMNHPPIPIEAIRAATGLCWSESHRWEQSRPATAKHWQDVAVALNGYLLALALTGDKEERRG